MTGEDVTTSFSSEIRPKSLFQAKRKAVLMGLSGEGVIILAVSNHGE